MTGALRQQVITRSNVDPDFRRHIASPDNGLKNKDLGVNRILVAIILNEIPIVHSAKAPSHTLPWHNIDMSQVTVQFQCDRTQNRYKSFWSKTLHRHIEDKLESLARIVWQVKLLQPGYMR